MYPTTPDERDIYEQYVIYYRHLDEGRFDDCSQFFAEASVHTPDGTWEGAGAARASLGRIRLHDGSPRTKHLLSTCDIVVGPEERQATALVYVMILQAAAGLPLRPIRVTWCDDVFVKNGERWRLTERDESIGRRDGDLTEHLVG